MEFNQAEKLAIVKMVDSVIIADEKIHNGEINAMQELMHRIGFDSNFIVDARNIEKNQCLLILDGMPDQKKKAMALLLKEMAEADGFVHEKEMTLILDICSTIGITQEY